MVYDDESQAIKNTDERMQEMLDNTAAGKCHDFAKNERLLFTSWNIKADYRMSWKINHAWCNIKCTNSAGKTLWIPFDYGIGPSDSLAVSEDVREKYLSTEKKRYKLYLYADGEPGKKNFTLADFN